MKLADHPCSSSMSAIEELFLSISIAMILEDKKGFNELKAELEGLHLPKEFIDDFAIKQMVSATHNGALAFASDEAMANNAPTIREMLSNLGASEDALDEGYTLGIQERNRHPY